MFTAQLVCSLYLHEIDAKLFCSILLFNVAHLDWCTIESTRNSNEWVDQLGLIVKDNIVAAPCLSFSSLLYLQSRADSEPIVSGQVWVNLIFFGGRVLCVQLSPHPFAT